MTNRKYGDEERLGLTLTQERPSYCPSPNGCDTLMVYEQDTRPRLCVGKLKRPVVTHTGAFDTHRVCFPGSTCYDEERHGDSGHHIISAVVVNLQDMSFFHGLFARLEADMQNE